MKRIILIFIFLTGSPGVFSAEDQPKSKIIYKKSESHRFSGLKLKGLLKKPELSYIYKRKGLRAEQIVNIPGNFNEEIVEGTRQF